MWLNALGVNFLAHKHEKKQSRRNEISSMHFGNSQRKAPKLFISEEFCYKWRDIAPSSFTISIITSFSRWYTETQTLLHIYIVNFQKKFELFFFFLVEKILISKLHYINEHKLIKTLSYKFRSLIFSIQVQSRLETFIEYRNYYSFRRSQFTNKPWWLTLTNNNQMEYFSLSLSLSLSLYIYIYISWETYYELILKGRLPRRVRELLGIMHYIYIYSYFHIVSLFFQFFLFLNFGPYLFIFIFFEKNLKLILFIYHIIYFC